MTSIQSGRVIRVSHCDLTVGQRTWVYATDNAAAIDAHWARRSAETPQFFNGRIFMLADFAIEHDTLKAEFFETEFKSFLYWREHGEKPGCGLIDGFGSALIQSADGALMLGKQRPGNINSGLAYLPGGFIDKRDIRDQEGRRDKEGRRVIDIHASIRREIAEETGLSLKDLTEQPGLIVTIMPAQISIAVAFTSSLNADALRDQMLAHIRSEADPELVDVIILRSADELKGLATPPYAQVLLNHLFTQGASSGIANF